MRLNNASILISLFFLVIIISLIARGQTDAINAQLCEPSSTQLCEAYEGCPGMKICKEDGSWSECRDYPDDNCPLATTKVCEPSSMRPCNTLESCPGMQTCRLDGSSWESCIDAPDDNCQIGTAHIICSPSSTQVCITSKGCQGIQVCKPDGSSWENCVDMPDDACPLEESRICEPNSTRICTTQEGCPGRRICLFDSTWSECRDYPDDNCPARVIQICNANEINFHSCAAADGSGIIQVKCRSNGSGWEQIGSCYKPAEEEMQAIFEEMGNLSGKMIMQDRLEVELSEEEKSLLQKWIAETNESREDVLKNNAEVIGAVEMEENEFRKYLEEKEGEFEKFAHDEIKKEARLKLLKKIEDSSVEEPKEKIPAVKEVKREFIEKARESPEFVVDTMLGNDKKAVLMELNKKRLVKENIDKAIENLKEGKVTLERVDEELGIIGKKIDGVDITKNLEQIENDYERAINHTKIEKVANIFEDEDIATGEKTNITMISLFIKTDKILYNLSLYESIPKEAASSSDEMIFYDDNFEIIESDPLIMWNFAVVDSDVEVSYSIKKKFNSEIFKDSKTVPIAKGIAEKGLDGIESTKDNPLFKLLFPVFITVSIVLIIIFFHKPSVKK